jgi:hypothetical protein
MLKKNSPLKMKVELPKMEIILYAGSVQCFLKWHFKLTRREIILNAGQRMKKVMGTPCFKNRLISNYT